MIFSTQKYICNRCQKEYNAIPLLHTSGLCSDCLYPKKGSIQEIIIRSEMIDLTSLQSSQHEELFRPNTFDEYKGQNNFKNILNAYLKGTKEAKKLFPHTLISGVAGQGKTTIAYIIAKTIGCKFVECVASSISSPQQFIDKLVEVDGGILFIDEMQTIKAKVANFILPILEDFQINGQKIKPFTCICATTEKGKLLRLYKPLVDRMKIQKELDMYKISEIIEIVKQYVGKTFITENLTNDAYQQIAENCKLTPRTAIRLAEGYIYMQHDFNAVLRSYNIVKNGYTQKDIKTLEILSQNEGGISVKSLAAMLNTSEENYCYEIENWLLQNGLISISSRRKITEKGKMFLNNV